MFGTISLRMLWCQLIVVCAAAAGVSDGFAQTTRTRPFDSLESDLFESEANSYRRAEAQVKYLNDFSKYVHDFIKWDDNLRQRLDEDSKNLDRMDPADPQYQAWVDTVNRNRETFYAWRAQQESEMIKFREVTAAQGWGTQHLLKDGVLRGRLDRAIRTAQGWIDYHDNRWPGRELRPRAATEITPGEPEPPLNGLPALETQITQTPPDPVEDEDWHPFNLWYRNNTARWIKVRSSLRVSAGNPEISPSKPHVFWLSPGESAEAGWSIRVFDEGRYGVEMKNEILGYAN